MLPGGIKTYNEMRSRGEMPFYMSMEHLTLSVLKEDFQLALKLRELVCYLVIADSALALGSAESAKYDVHSPHKLILFVSFNC